MPEVDLLVLASSRKHGGRCIAGWDLTNERWLRPVSARADGTLELQHCSVNGIWPEVFDVVHFEIGAHRPSPYQSENYVIAEAPWQLVRNEDPADASDLLEDLTDENHWLLQSGDRRVQAEALRANPASSSLVLVEPSSLTWRRETPPWGRQCKADFRVGDGGWYDWSVTDIPIYEQLRELDDGNYPRDTVGIDDDSDVFLTISLSEPYEENDTCYKLVAAVLET